MNGQGCGDGTRRGHGGEDGLAANCSSKWPKVASGRRQAISLEELITTNAVALKELGVSHDQSSRWQKKAAVTGFGGGKSQLAGSLWSLPGTAWGALRRLNLQGGKTIAIFGRNLSAVVYFLLTTPSVVLLVALPMELGAPLAPHLRSGNEYKRSKAGFPR
jgi:hypothetical protein